jgi:predicted phage terminase large subunit-like protein
MPTAAIPKQITVQPGVRYIGPQPGPQELFLSTPADIAVYGGAAGGGKTFGLLYDASTHAALDPVPGFGAVIFRRTSPQITQEGGLWDEAGKLYPLMGGVAKHRTKIRFAHMQYESDRFNWQGSQIAYCGFDELCHFTEEQFFYLLSRNRSTCGIKPRVRATCNPDADSWVKHFLGPWVDEKWPVRDRARSGEIRRFIREDGQITWLSRGQRHPDAKTVTFIAASIYDNPALLATNPEYLVNLKALPLVERERLLGGNWVIRKEGGKVFKKTWFRQVEDIPPDIIRLLRFWDIAATEDERKEKKNEERGGPDYTASCLIGLTAHGTFIVLDATWDRKSALEVDTLMRETAAADRELARRLGCSDVIIRCEQEPGGSGKRDIAHIRQLLFEFDFLGVPPDGDKIERSRIPSTHVEARNVLVLEREWTDGFLNFLEAFPNPKVHDDVPDAFDGAMLCLINSDAGGVVEIAPNVATALNFFF